MRHGQHLVGGQCGRDSGCELPKPAVSSALTPRAECAFGAAAPLGRVCCKDDASAAIPGVVEREEVMFTFSDERRGGSMQINEAMLCGEGWWKATSFARTYFTFRAAFQK